MKIALAREIARNPRAYSQDELRIAKLKLFGAALKAFPSSPAQKEIHAMIMSIHQQQET